MIPNRLQVQNFMTYGENSPEINFEGLDLVCLAGQNGAGKSTLLESICWALWGKSRAKSDDDLVRYGKEEMNVVFEFEVEDNKYRVIRKRSKKKRGQGQLDFFIFQNDDWQPLTGTSKNETQEKIIDTLHLNYETFINSAFLRQGHADEFTIKRPQERKAILTDILGLEKYDLLQEKAKEKARIKEIELEGLNNLISAFEEEIKDKKTLEENLKEKEKCFKEISDKTKKKEAEIASLREEKYLMENQERMILDFSRKVKEEKNEIESLEQEIKDRKEKFLDIAKLFSKKSEILKGFSEFLELKKEEEMSYQAFIARQKLLEEKNFLERTIYMSERKKENQIAEIDGQIRDRKNNISRQAQIAEEGKQLKTKYDFLEKKESEKKEFEKKAQGLKEEIIKIEEKVRHFQNKKKETQENLNTLLNAQALCPLCQQILSQEHKDSLKNRLKKELDSFDSEIAGCNKQKQQLTSQINELRQEIINLEKVLLSKQTVLDQLTFKRQEYLTIIDSKKEIIKLEENKNKLSKIDDKTVSEQKNRLVEIEAKLKENEYDEKKHQTVQKERQKKEKYQELKTRLEEAEKNKDFEERQIKIKEGALAKKKETLSRDEKQKKKITFDAKQFAKIKKELEMASAGLEEFRTKMMTAKEDFGIAKERLTKMDLKEKEISDKKKKISGAQKEAEVYDEIAEAFGKKGIQAMVIEAVLPEIEEEANNLLNKMTEGRMRIKIITQKEKKSEEGLQETLDIQITDGEEIRPYEMFSGGEAFRINFAIRIALSKLLTRRAGAKLQFLVIDEGFGTQDSTGKEYVISAINSICGEFKKVIVITHIPEIKDSFPARIEVTKGESGSTFEIVHAS